jgi:methylglutaconyl-CoA hydratase
MTDLDKDLMFYVAGLAAYNPMALRAWRKVLWEGTEHWGQLLTERAAITGQLALSEFTKNALGKLKK